MLNTKRLPRKVADLDLFILDIYRTSLTRAIKIKRAEGNQIKLKKKEKFIRGFSKAVKGQIMAWSINGMRIPRALSKKVRKQAKAILVTNQVLTNRGFTFFRLIMINTEITKGVINK
jgi:hypothetical protein